MHLQHPEDLIMSESKPVAVSEKDLIVRINHRLAAKALDFLNG